MVRRIWRTVRFVLAAALAAAPAIAEAPPKAGRIVAVGDLHGDFAVWRDIARDAGIVDSRGRWTGGTTTLVQVGDVVDRGPDSLKIVRELMRLQREAPKRGGKVIALVGNHEAMNVTGDLRYVTPEEFAAFETRKSPGVRERLYEVKKAEIEAQYRAKGPAMTPAAIREAWFAATPLGWVEQRLAWAPDGQIGAWVIGNPAVAMVGGTLFVHGGLSAEYSALSIDEINRQLSSALKAVDRSPQGILNAPLGPLWYRGLITRDPAVTEIPPGGAERMPIEQELAAVLAAYGAKRIIVGHTPSRSGIHIDHGGKLVRIDSANSSHYGGQPSWLEIVGDRLVPHSVVRSGR